MTSRRYENFDLLIEEEHDGYQARVTACPSNETPSERFAFSLDETKLENLLLKLDPGRSDMRRGSGDPREAASRELGGALYSAVFTGEVREAWIRSRELVQQRELGLRLRLKLTDAPKLAGLPWELLYNTRTNQYPAQSEATPVIRFLGDRGTAALHVTGPLTILFVLASPTDLPELDLENEWRAVNQELAPLVSRGLVRLERLSHPATPGRLLERLGESPVHIIHFVGHGDFDEATQDGVVYLCTNYSTKNPIGADRLGSVLQDVQDLKLVVLNACHSARGDNHDVYGGMAQGLVQYSVSAVAAMQFPISDRAASAFSRALYRAIAKGYPVDQAMAGARKSLLMDFPSEWATPVLYLRSNDGVLFDLPKEDAPPISAQVRAVPIAPSPPVSTDSSTVGASTAGAAAIASTADTPVPADPPVTAPGSAPFKPVSTMMPRSAKRQRLWWIVAGLAVVVVAVAFPIAAQWGDRFPPTPPSPSPTTSATTAPALALVAGHMPTPPKLDLDGSADWPGTGTLLTADQPTITRDGASKLTALWVFAWDADNLYFFVDVTDRSMDSMPTSGATRVTFDELIVLIGRPSTKDALQAGDAGLVIAPAIGTRIAHGSIVAPDANGLTMSSRGPAGGFAATVGPTERGYRVEGQVLWRTLGLQGAKANDQFSITVAAVDADQSGIKSLVRDNARAIGQDTEASWRSAWKRIQLTA